MLLWSGLAVFLLLIFTSLMVFVPGSSFKGALPDLSPRQARIRAELERHVHHLSIGIGERNMGRYKQLQKAVLYIESHLRHSNVGVERQEYTIDNRLCINLSAEIKGQLVPEEIVIVGAHYDSVTGSPGANDNASGIAALLVLANTFRTEKIDRTLRFVAFANEEPPFFQTPQMGSVVYARRCRERKENISAMLAFDGLGYFTDERGSQRYPFPLNLIYPSQGDFIGIVGNPRYLRLFREVVGSFRKESKFPSEAAILPSFVPGAGWSDHWSFWKAGYPAVLVTDTLPFRYPSYHSFDDTPDKLDFERFARVVDGIESGLMALVDRG